MEKTLLGEIQRIQSAKDSIREALIAKEVSVPEGATLDSFSTLIDNMKGGTSSAEVTATKANVLAGTTTITSDSNDQIVEGTMPNIGAVSQSLNCGGTFSIPQGYHNGSGIITANDLASQTPGNVSASQILSSYTAWSNGIQVTGSLAVTSAISFKTATLSASSIRISWTNPSKGAYSGVKIRYSTSGYPGVSGGTLVYTGTGSSASPGGSSYVDITGLNLGTTYYFTCTSYATGIGDGLSNNVSATTSGLILYDNGSNPYKLSGSSSTDVSKIVFNSDHIYFPGGYRLKTSSAINVSNYSKMKMNIIVVSGEIANRYIYLDFSGMITDWSTQWSSSAIKTHSFDISSRSSLTDFGLGITSNGTSGRGFQHKIYKIWLE